MIFKLNLKKTATILILLISTCKVYGNSNQFIKDLQKAESFYLTRSTNLLDQNNSKLKEKLLVLKKLYKHQKELHENLITKQQDKNKKEIDLEFKQLQLTKEIIRNLEKHLKENHNWKRLNHFSNIVKPLIATTTLATLTMLTLKLAKLSGLTNDQKLLDYKINKATIIGGYTTIASLWILINYLNNFSTK